PPPPFANTGASKTALTMSATLRCARTPRVFAKIPASSPESAASPIISCGSTRKTPAPRTATPPLPVASIPCSLNEIPWGVDSSQFCEQTGVVYPLNPRRRPMSLDHHREELTAIRTNLGAIFVSLELSRSIWLITSLSPGSGEKMSKHRISAGDIAALLTRFSELKQKAFARTGKSFPIIVIQEAGLDGFWIHRVLQSEGIES